MLRGWSILGVPPCPVGIDTAAFDRVGWPDPGIMTSSIFRDSATLNLGMAGEGTLGGWGLGWLPLGDRFSSCEGALATLSALVVGESIDEAVASPPQDGLP